MLLGDLFWLVIFIVVVFIVIRLDGPQRLILGGNDYVVKYYTFPSEIDLSFREQVRNILTNSRWNTKYNIKEVDDAKSANVHIYLTARKDLDYAHKEPEYYESNPKKQIRFSITTQSHTMHPRIDIDSLNWLNGVEESGLTLQQYRSYVIEHEFGHALGHDHLECLNGQCPVMYQATRGCGSSKCSYTVSDKDLNGELLTNKYVFKK